MFAMFGAVDLVYLSLALIFGTLLRLPLHILLAVRFESGLPAGDLSGVLTKLEDMRRRKWVDYTTPDSLVEGIFAYPVFFHWLVSRFPRASWRAVSIALNVVPDLIAATVVYLVVVMRLPRWAARPLSADEISAAAFLAALILLTLPILLPVTARMKSTNGRAFGMLLVLVCWSSVAMFIEGHAPAMLALAVVAALLTILTSMFGTQALAFSAIPLALLYRDPAPLTAIIVAAGLAWVLPALGARDVLRFKYHHFLWYRRNKFRIRTSASKRTFLTGLMELPRLLLNQPRRVRALVLADSPLLIAAYSLPPLWLLGFSLADAETWTRAWSDPITRFCLASVLASTVVFVVTSLKPFVEWGQAERYFEYTAPMIVLAAMLLGYGTSFAWPALVVTLIVQLSIALLLHVYAAYPVWRLVNHYPNDESEREIARYFDRIPGTITLSALPQQMQRYWPRLFRYEAQPRVKHLFGFILQSGAEAGHGFAYMDAIFGDNYQIPSLTPGELHRAHGVDYIIGLKGFLHNNRRQPFVSALEHDYAIAFENDKYRIYRISAAIAPAMHSAAP